MLYAHSKGFSIKRNRMKICLFVYYFTALIFLINKIESGNKKLQKSFDEIFGEEWEKRANSNLEDGHGVDQRDGIDQDHLKILKSDQNKNYLSNSNGEPTDQNVGGHEKVEQRGNNQQKKEIICKFYAIKEKMKEKGIKFSNKKKNKIEKTIAKKLGTNRTAIYKWIRKYGMGKQKTHSNDYSDQQKREIIRKFYAIKEKIKQKGIKYSKKERSKFESTIAKKLGTNRDYIYKWIKELGMGIIKKTNDEIYSEKRKFQKLQQFITMCNEYKQKGTYSKKEWAQNYAEISKKLEISYRKIQKWRKKFGMNRKYYTNEEKLRMMKQYWEMKQKHPKINDNKIAEALQVDKKYISKWRVKFQDEFSSLGKKPFVISGKVKMLF